MKPMKKRVPIAIAAVLTACGAVATTSNDSAESAPQKGTAKQQQTVGFPNYEQGGMAGCFDPKLSGYARAAAERIGGVPCAESSSTGASGNGTTAAGSWAGRYEGSFDGGEGEAILTGPSRVGNNYNAELSVAGGGCSGQASAAGAPRGNVLTLEIPTGNMADDNAGLCRITLTRQGDTLRVRENGCAELHGMSCGFSGSVARRGGTTSASDPVSVGESSWLVGAWVSRGVACGGEGLVYEADGTYGSDAQSGRWQLTGTTLTETALATVELGEDSTPIRNPRPVRSQILAIAPNRNAFAMRTANGEVWHMVRCR
jgi:hypothetical protein